MKRRLIARLPVTYWACKDILLHNYICERTWFLSFLMISLCGLRCKSRLPTNQKDGGLMPSSSCLYVSLGKIQNPELPLMHPTECKCTCEYYIKVLWYRDSIETFHFQCPNLAESCEISKVHFQFLWYGKKYGQHCHLWLQYAYCDYLLPFLQL